MYKDKKITFKQVNPQKIDIFLEYEDFKKEGSGFEKKSKIIGHIFSPSGSGNDITNAIQICGSSEAFELWGCGMFGKPKTILSKQSLGRQYYHDSKGNKIIEQVKDIQLFFDEDTIEHEIDNLDMCNRCFNVECTCENKQHISELDIMDGNLGRRMPYNVKFQKDVLELGKKKKK